MSTPTVSLIALVAGIFASWWLRYSLKVETVHELLAGALAKIAKLRAAMAVGQASGEAKKVFLATQAALLTGFPDTKKGQSAVTTRSTDVSSASSSYGATPPAAALATSEKYPSAENDTGAAIVADLIAQKRLSEIFGLLGLVSEAAQEKLLAKLPLLPWYPPDPSEGGIWREE